MADGKTHFAPRTGSDAPPCMRMRLYILNPFCTIRSLKEIGFHGRFKKVKREKETAAEKKSRLSILYKRT